MNGFGKTILLGVSLLMPAQVSAAAERLVVTCGRQTGWDQLVTNFGIRKGFFQDQGLEIEIVDLDTAAPTLQAVAAGSVDLAVGVGIAGFIGAAMNGAPVRMISANVTGARDLAWYVRSDSPIRSFKDVTPDTTVAYASAGSSGLIISQALMKQAGVMGKSVATGNGPATLTQVMTGQVDIGVAGNDGIGIDEFKRGDVRIIGTGADLVSFRDQTVRGIVVTDKTLRERRDLIVRYMQAYKQTIDWMYQDPAAIQWFADQLKTDAAEAKQTVDLIYPKEALRLGPVHGLEATIEQSIEFKRIPSAPTAEQIDQMFPVVWTPPPEQ